MSLEDKIPTVNWPKKSGIHKVIQLEIDDALYLRFGEELSAMYHGSILQETLGFLHIPYTRLVIDSHPTGMVDMGQHRASYTVPNRSGSRYNAVGMGFAVVDVEKKKAELYGMSNDYLIGVDNDHLNKIQALVPEWNIMHKT